MKEEQKREKTKGKKGMFICSIKISNSFYRINYLELFRLKCRRPENLLSERI